MRRMLGHGLILLALSVAGALAWLYTPDKQRVALEAEYARPPSVFLDVAATVGILREFLERRCQVGRPG